MLEILPMVRRRIHSTFMQPDRCCRVNASSSARVTTVASKIITFLPNSDCSWGTNPKNSWEATRDISQQNNENFYLMSSSALFK